MLTDATSLLESISRGDHEAFRTLFDMFFPKVKVFLVNFLKDDKAAEDIAQDIFVKRCSFDGTIDNAGRRQGGIVGYHNVQIADAYLRIEDCWTAGSITGQQQVAGILGQTQLETGKSGNKTRASLIKNCYSRMAVTADRNAGGICGSCSYGGTYHDTQLDIQKDMVIGCIAWNEKVEAKKTATGNYSSAPVVGYCNKYQYFQNCWRKADMDFKCPVTDAEFSITAVDQENSSPDMPMLGGTVEDPECTYGYKYAYPYHGKAAAAGATVSSVAKQLKWNQNVWDLSGEYPVLK